jgi:hypothetical protein
MPQIEEDQRTGEAMEQLTVVIPRLTEERSIGTVIDDVPVADLLETGPETAVWVIGGQSAYNASPQQANENAGQKHAKKKH